MYECFNESLCFFTHSLLKERLGAFNELAESVAHGLNQLYLSYSTSLMTKDMGPSVVLLQVVAHSV